MADTNTFRSSKEKEVDAMYGTDDKKLAAARLKNKKKKQGAGSEVYRGTGSMNQGNAEAIRLAE